MQTAMKWDLHTINPTAIGVCASRRTDIPALYGEWFSNSLDRGLVEYAPAGPPRRIRRSIRPEDVTHFNFWSKWPKPFFPVLKKVQGYGFPVLWNVTITGFGSTPVEPGVPPPDKAVDAVIELSQMVSPAAIQWRYDPIFLSAKYGADHHEMMFRYLAGRLAGHVDRVAVSFVVPFARRVAPGLKRYAASNGDGVITFSAAQQLDLLACLRRLALASGVRFTLCCSAGLVGGATCQSSGCNSWPWVCRVYPALAALKPLPGRGKGGGCTCSREFDIGAYDTCTLGCVYSYGTCDRGVARRRFDGHDPAGLCILPSRPAPSPPASDGPFVVIDP